MEARAAPENAEEARPCVPPPLPGHFEFVARPPSPDLAGLVTRLTGYRETGAGPVRQYEVASLAVPLIIGFGDPFRIGLGGPPGEAETYGSFAAGLFGGHVVIDSFGSSHCLQVDFTPLGARRFFGLPMRDLAGRMVPIEDLPCPGLRPLRERLGEAPRWAERFALVEDFIRLRTARAAGKPGPVAQAYAAILASGGTVRIQRLAAQIGWSRKHLVARFREEVGLAPKEVARIVRFNCVLSLVADDDASGWADIAAACGYADQPHLAREFRALAGAPPKAWQARLGW